MFLINTKRIIVSGYRNFVRSGFTSVSSILIMTITLFVITSQIFVQAALNNSLNSIKDRVDITVYFVPRVDYLNIDKIKTDIEKLPEVKEVSYISEEQSLLDFKEKHANDYLTLQALEEIGENPLGATLNIKARDPSQYESIVKYFASDDAISNGALTIIDKIDYHQNKVVIDKLTSIITGAQRIGFLISLILILISLFITFNTIRLIIYMSRDEISVMRLVGAGGRHIRGPFVVSGIFVGIISSILATVIFFPVTKWLGNNMAEFLGINMFNYFKENLLQLFFIMIVSGIVIGSISSSLAVAKYLRKK